MRFALFLLLVGFALRFLALGSCETFTIFLVALVFGCACLVKSDGDRLLPTFDLAALSFGSAFEFAMHIFVHNPTDGSSLSR